MKKIVYNLLVFILILTTPAINAYCGESKTADALAIIGEAGKLIKLNIDSKKGDGVLTNLSIIYSMDTQESIINAYKVAKKLTGEKCLFTIGFPDLDESIYGSSAGALIATKFYEILSNRTPKLSYVITGAIDEYGNVLPIGGIYEKAGAFLDSSYEVLLFSGGNNDIDLIVASLVEEKGKKAYPIRHIDDIINYIFENKGLEIDIKDYLPKVPESKATYPSYKIKNLSDYYIEKEKEYLERTDGLPYYYKKYLLESIKIQEKIEGKEYYYSSANEAFNRLSFLLGYITEIKKDEKELYEKAKKCVDDIKFYDEREDNVELITGAKVRYYRAKEALEKYDEVENKKELLYFDRVELFSSLARALLWCESAKEWNVPGKGKYVDKEDLAIKIVEMGINESEEEGRFKKMLEDEEYLAYLYEYSFSSNGSTQLKKQYKTFWGNVYASQAEYLIQTQGEGEDIAMIANNLEELFTSLKYKENIIETNKTNEEKSKDIYYVYLLIPIAFVGGVLICVLLRRLRI